MECVNMKNIILSMLTQAAESENHSKCTFRHILDFISMHVHMWSPLFDPPPTQM